MQSETIMDDAPAPQVTSWKRAGVELFLISVLILFLELACIRWFPAHVLFLTFFTNTVLLACFLGMSLGCLGAGHKRNYLMLTPVFLGIALAAGVGIEYGRHLQLEDIPRFLRPIVVHLLGQDPSFEKVIDVHQAAPQLVFFGTEYHAHDPTSGLRVPIEAIAGLFFLMITLSLIGPGQELGRALARYPNRVGAYTINILGSIVGIVLFGMLSFWQRPPLWWFAPIVLLLGYFLFPRNYLKWLAVGLIPAVIVWLASLTSGPYVPAKALISEHLWSPYYRVDFDHQGNPDLHHNFITVNLIGHQLMLSHDEKFPPYALPHLLNRDAQREAGQEPKPFSEVMIIGAGSGNDVSRALQWGAGHVDAVEIDPVIQRLGAKYHPDKPYEDPRVTAHLNDGRNFLRNAPDGKYDLIVYALVDSLVLHSGYSNIRLESYLFTDQAFADVKRCLKPDGVFVMYNYFRQGWIVARLHKGLTHAFGDEPLVLRFPVPYDTVEPEQKSEGFTMCISGATAPFRQAFEKHGQYWLKGTEAPSSKSGNGFEIPSSAERAAAEAAYTETLKTNPWAEPEWHRFRLAKVNQPAEPLRTASDDWPFLYLRKPMIPDLSVRGMAMMGGIAFVLLLIFLPRRQQVERESAGEGWGFLAQMFFLGAGFMLVETKAVVHMALLFGSTWMVNSIVFFAVLVMILAANLFVLKMKPQRLGWAYLGLLATLVTNSLVPLDFFLGMNRLVQIGLSCLLVFAPILFAGVIFAVKFSRSQHPDRAFGANIAGAMLGGLAENASMLIGFQYLVLVALAFYTLSAIGGRPAATGAENEKETPAVPPTESREPAVHEA